MKKWAKQGAKQRSKAGPAGHLQEVAKVLVLVIGKVFQSVISSGFSVSLVPLLVLSAKIEPEDDTRDSGDCQTNHESCEPGIETWRELAA